MVIQPHAAHRLKAHEGAKKGTDKRYKPTKNGNGTGNYVCNNGIASSATNPGHPMRRCVACEMLRATQNTHEEVLCCKVHEQGGADEQAGQSNSITNLLHHVAC